jgi:hypothetical protein
VMKAVQRDPKAASYMDQALMPVTDDGDETSDLMTKTGGAQAAIAHIRKVNDLTHAQARGAA